MLLNFNFANYASFKDDCEFTMVTNNDNSHEENLINLDKERLSKVRLIYGPNASGKSKFITAMHFFTFFINRSNAMMPNFTIPVTPFKFRKDPFNYPSKFEITFIAQDIKYNYSFSCTNKKVIDEKLIAYYSSKPTTIFLRTNTNEYHFTNDQKLLNEIKDKNTDNKLFLSTSATWNYAKTIPVVEYLNEHILVIENIDQEWKIYMDKIYTNGDLDDFKKFSLNFLNDADITINDFDVKANKINEIDKNFASMMTDFMPNIDNKEEAIEQLSNSYIYNFNTVHETNDTRFQLNLEEESLGTVYMFKLSTILYDIFKHGKVLFIDELDKSLHSLLVEKIIRMFNDPLINPKGAQLIANTHDTNLLNQELIRRDDIYFIERDEETLSSTIYNLTEFSPRKDENIEKAYLLGRFGAIPFIK